MGDRRSEIGRTLDDATPGTIVTVTEGERRGEWLRLETSGFNDLDITSLWANLATGVLLFSSHPLADDVYGQYQRGEDWEVD